MFQKTIYFLLKAIVEAKCHFLDTTARQCKGEPPTPHLFMDMDWPHKSRDLGAIITYNCPYRYVTDPERSTGMTLIRWSNLFADLKRGKLCAVQYSHCVHDKDTDEMVWWPSYVKKCDGAYQFILQANEIICLHEILLLFPLARRLRWGGNPRSCLPPFTRYFGKH